MSTADESTLDLLFLKARTHTAWLDRPVDDETLRRIYELAKMAPTAANTQPLRVLYVKSREAKELLRPGLAPGNVDKTMNAPATAVLAFDSAFHEQMPKLFPARDMKTALAQKPDAERERMAADGAMLQAGYFILAARSLGLDCGPMGGFDKAKVDAAFFEGTTWRSVVLVNLGHGDAAKLHPRNPRLDFEEAGKIV